MLMMKALRVGWLLVAGLASTIGLVDLAGCGNKNVADMGGSKDMAVGGDMPASGDMTLLACCGKPGDTGNSLGVGKYCTSGSDCTNPGATVCANLLGDERFHFCTTTCTKGSDGGSACGENASCRCMGQGMTLCGCTPDSCVNNAPPGCPATQ